MDTHSRFLPHAICDVMTMHGAQNGRSDASPSTRLGEQSLSKAQLCSHALVWVCCAPAQASDCGCDACMGSAWPSAQPWISEHMRFPSDWEGMLLPSPSVSKQQEGSVGSDAALERHNMSQMALRFPEHTFWPSPALDLFDGFALVGVAHDENCIAFDAFHQDEASSITSTKSII